MNGQTFTVGEALSQGWRLTKTHLPFLIGYFLIMLAITAFFSTINYKYDSALAHLLGSIIGVFVQMGFYKSALMITDGIKPNFDQLYANWHLFIYWLVAYFLFGALFFLGMILFIIPALYVLARYGLFPYFIVDKGMGPLEALKAAGQASEGKRWQLFLLYIAAFGVNFLGALLFGIGLLFTIPLTMLAFAYVYRKITSSEQLMTEKLITDNTDNSGL